MNTQRHKPEQTGSVSQQQYKPRALSKKAELSAVVVLGCAGIRSYLRGISTNKRANNRQR